jgi:hypothetical protein
MSASGRRGSKQPSVRVPLSGRRLALAGLATVVLVFLAWRIIAETNAVSLARVDPEAALAWKSGSAPALMALAEERLTKAGGDGDFAEANELAARALAANPLEGRALTLMALSDEYRGKNDDAAKAMARAGTRSLRDDTAQGWLFNRSVLGSDFAGAIGHADALLRTESPLGPAVIANLVAFAGEPDARSALLAALSRKPPWRHRMLAELGRSGIEPNVVFALLSDLAASPNPPTAGEIFPFLDHLISKGAFELAYVVWIRFLPKERSGNLKYVYNGDFEYPNSGLPFDWVLVPTPAAGIDILDTGAAERGKALRAAFTGARVKYGLATTDMLLPPGRYRVSGLMKSDGIATERGLHWVLACIDARQTTLLTTTEPQKGSFAWRPFEAEFDVPPGCRAQRMALRVDSRAALDEQVSGTAWFDDLKVERLAPAGTDG